MHIEVPSSDLRHAPSWWPIFSLLLIFFASTSQALDKNLDGMSDIWQKLHHVPAGDGNMDYDFDGVINCMEAIAGTNPRDPFSYFRCSSIRLIDSSYLVLTVRAERGRFYTIESSNDLKEWKQETEAVEAAAPEEVVEFYGDNHKRFWRAKIVTPEELRDDTDRDGLDRWEELAIGTDPESGDSDEDGMPDDWEFEHGLSPINDDQTDGGDGDLDGDGLSNMNEYRNLTLPNLPDTDGDGVSDGIEVNQNSDPVNTADSVSHDENGVVTVRLKFGITWYTHRDITGNGDYIGDPTKGGVIMIKALSGDTRNFRLLPSPTTIGPRGGDSSNDRSLFAFRRGASYEFTLDFGSFAGKATSWVEEPSGGYFYYALMQPVTGLAFTDDKGFFGVNIHMARQLGQYYPIFSELPADHKGILVCPTFKFVTPYGDPVSEPDTFGQGQNEFSFDASQPGVAQIDPVVSVEPIEAAEILASQVRFDPDNVEGSSLEWALGLEGGKALQTGGMLYTRFVYRGLPDLNSSFGRKTIKLIVNSKIVDSTNYELFFQRDATNHPGEGNGETPNWFYYWAGTAVPGYDTTSGHYSYANGSAFQYANYNGDPITPHYTIYGPASVGHNKYIFSILDVDRKGIDTLAMTIAHEKAHRQVDLNWLPGGVWHGMLDSDGDELPDDWESEYFFIGFDKNNKFSFPDFPLEGDDEEFFAEIQAFGAKGNPTEDWACPGKQSGQYW